MIEVVNHPFLSTEALTAGYAGATVLHGISLEVRHGEIVAVIGSNGAGKTTLLSTITGLLTPTSGAIRLRGEAIEGLAPERIVKRGVSLVQEGRQVVPQLSVDENLRVGAFLRNDAEGIEADISYIHEVFPRLRERSKQAAGSMSGGEQQMLAIGRALMARPALLLLDEPSMGLAPLIIDRIFEVLLEINKSGTALLLVEQNARQALRLAHRAYVIEQGAIRLEGSGVDVAADPTVIDAYLGGR